jgi:hypothetical protein
LIRLHVLDDLVTAAKPAYFDSLNTLAVPEAEVESHAMMVLSRPTRS